jgi:dienelactone hydrolase
MRSSLCAVALLLFATLAASAESPVPPDAAASMRVVPFVSRTVSDAAFLAGDKSAAKDVQLAGVLRLPVGRGPFPVVVLVEGSGGIGENIDFWDRDFLSHGVGTFIVDGFTGRGIDNVIEDQSQLGLMNMIVDVYRGIGAIAKNPSVDPKRIAVMGYSRGGLTVLYAALKRFQDAWNDSGVTPAAYIPLYPVCNFQYRQGEDVVGGPIRIFHGEADDYVPIAPCQDYVKRLKAAGKDVEITPLSGAYHAYDNALLPPALELPKAQKTSCILVEDASGAMIDQATGKPWAPDDPCNGVGAHIGYSAEATATTLKAVNAFVVTVLGAK